jgi:preprotein translocase subunit SecE
MRFDGVECRVAGEAIAERMIEVAMTEKSKNLLVRTREYVAEVHGEFNKITWPPQAETRNGTVSVMIIVALIATFLGVVDFGLSRVMQMVLG